MPRPRARDRRQRSAGPPRSSAPSPVTRSRRSTGHALDITDPDAVAQAVAQARAGRSSSTAPHSTTWTAPRTGRSRRWPSTPSRCAAWRVAARAAGATLVHYSTDFVFDGARQRSPTTETRRAVAAEHLRGVEADGRVVRARRAARARAARRKPVRLAGRAGRAGAARWTPSSTASRAGREVPVLTDRVVSPSYSPDVAAATRHLVDRAAPRRASITASTPARPPGSRWRAKSRAQLGVEPRAEAADHATS